MCRWLGYGTEKEKSAADNLLCRREFSFTTGDDVYIRYLSYGTKKEKSAADNLLCRREFS